jgi:hypothetical protein
METKIKPRRIGANNSPQVWYVPKYFSPTEFEWWEWSGAWLPIAWTTYVASPTKWWSVNAGSTSSTIFTCNKDWTYRFTRSFWHTYIWITMTQSIKRNWVQVASIWVTYEWPNNLIFDLAMVDWDEITITNTSWNWPCGYSWSITCDLIPVVDASWYNT